MSLLFRFVKDRCVEHAKDKMPPSSLFERSILVEEGSNRRPSACQSRCSPKPNAKPFASLFRSLVFRRLPRCLEVYRVCSTDDPIGFRQKEQRTLSTDINRANKTRSISPDFFRTRRQGFDVSREILQRSHGKSGGSGWTRTNDPALSRRCSNQLSYKPKFPRNRSLFRDFPDSSHCSLRQPISCRRLFQRFL